MSDANIHKRLRTEAVKLLNLDEANLSPLQSMQCDLVGVLMLEIDTFQAQQLANRSVDVGKVADAVKILKSLLPAATAVIEPTREQIMEFLTAPVC